MSLGCITNYLWRYINRNQYLRLCLCRTNCQKSGKNDPAWGQRFLTSPCSVSGDVIIKKKYPAGGQRFLTSLRYVRNDRRFRGY